MYRMKENHKEKIVMPIPFSGLLIMVVGAMLYVISVIGTFSLGWSIITVGITDTEATIYFILSMTSIIGMLMFLFGSIMQMLRLVNVIKTMQQYSTLQEFEKEKRY